jgi:hypothetical protein
VFPPAVKLNVLIKKFVGKDHNEDDFLTRDEWKSQAAAREIGSVCS